jgi:hypothetical protein
LHILFFKSYELIYEGDQLEHLIDPVSLLPGHVYHLRASCANSIGQSDLTLDPVTFHTPAAPPAKCSPPKLSVSKPKPNSVQLKWNAPDQDGGSPVINYELKLILQQEPSQDLVTTSAKDSNNNNNSSEIDIKCADLACVLTTLLPGRAYQAKLRAVNKVGPGPWSDELEFVSGAGSPEPPSTPTIQARSASFLLIQWSEPCNNGAPITDYRLEWSLKDSSQVSFFFGQIKKKFF